MEAGKVGKDGVVVVEDVGAMEAAGKAGTNGVAAVDVADIAATEVGTNGVAVVDMAAMEAGAAVDAMEAAAAPRAGKGNGSMTGLMVPAKAAARLETGLTIVRFSRFTRHLLRGR